MNKVGDNNIDFLIQTIQNDYKKTGKLKSFQVTVQGQDPNNIEIQYGNSKINNQEFKSLIDKSKDIFKDKIGIIQSMYQQFENINNKSIQDNRQWVELVEYLKLANKVDLINKIRSIYELDVKKLNMTDQDFQIFNTSLPISLDYQMIKMQIDGLGEFLKNEHLVDVPYDQLLTRYETERFFSRKLMNALYDGDREFSQEDQLKLIQEKITDLLENDIVTDDLVRPAKTPNSETALHLAVLAGDKASIDLIKEHWGDHFSTLLEERAENQFNLTPLQMALYAEKIDIARYLLELGANPAVNGFIKNYNPLLKNHNLFLSWLFEYKKLAAIDFCLSLPEMNLSSVNLFKENFLHILFKRPEYFQQEYFQKWLSQEEIKKYANTPNIFGDTPLDIAIQYKNDEVIKLLMGEIDVHSFPNYRKQPISIDQMQILSQLFRYLGLKENRDLSTLSYNGCCNGFSFLMAYYMARGKENEFFEILRFISQWDGTLESLEKSEPVKKFSGEYKNGEELFDQWVNDIAWFQHDHGSQTKIFSPITGLKYDDRVRIYEIVKKDNLSICERVLSSLNGLPTSPEETALRVEEILKIGLLLPNSTIEFIAGGHITNAWVQEDGGIKYYDSNIPDELPTFYFTEEASQFITNAHLEKQQFWVNIHRFVDLKDQHPMIDEGKRREQILTLFNHFSTPSPNGFTPLHIAILINDLTMFKDYLSQGANFHASMKDTPITPMDLALERPNWKEIMAIHASRFEQPGKGR